MRKKKIPEKIPTQNDIPDPTRVHTLSVYDGKNYLGCVAEHYGTYFAFGADDALVGEFITERDAIHALPAAKVTDARS